jgi:ABC-2 type transport system ATP-binding protein
MNSALHAQDVSFRYGLSGPLTLDQVTFSLVSPTITGLLGRNGSGKSTLGMLMAGLLHPTSGTLTLDGERIYDGATTMAHVAYAGDSTAVFDDRKLSETVALWAASRPAWDQNFAEELLGLFSLNTKKKTSKLSRGQLSAFFAVLGLASRAPLTIFDEVHLGMDAVVRELFYRALLADFTAHPRIIVLSSHLIDEVENLLDHVIMVDSGQVIEEGDTDEVRARHALDGSLPHLTDVLMDLTLTNSQRRALGREN